MTGLLAVSRNVTLTSPYTFDTSPIPPTLLHSLKLYKAQTVLTQLLTVSIIPRLDPLQAAQDVPGAQVTLSLTRTWRSHNHSSAGSRDRRRPHYRYYDSCL
jgi:hypothetical protein